ncbi:hypothetical protein Q427_19620 [Halomonas sp. BC04]|nr:hypothetical protein Q427_19620 [Halomonas sp. BC04]
MVQEAAENTNFDKSNINYIALEGGAAHVIGDRTVRKARHYSEIEKIIPLAKLRKVVEILRAPGGCPNDAAENWASIIEHFREETEEVAETVEKGDISNLCEELGDMMFNIMLMCHIAEQEKLFTIEEVISGSAEKMIRGHDKVFTTDQQVKF